MDNGGNRDKLEIRGVEEEICGCRKHALIYSPIAVSGACWRLLEVGGFRLILTTEDTNEPTIWKLVVKVSRAPVSSRDRKRLWKEIVVCQRTRTMKKCRLKHQRI